MKSIEYFYSSHSAFAYFGSARLRQIARTAGAKLIHRPVDLRALLEAVGPGPTGLLTQDRHDYFFGREIARWAQFREAPIKHLRPTWHDHALDKSSGMLLVAIELGLDVDSLAHEMLTAHWRDDADLINDEHLRGIARAAGLDPEPLLARAMSPEIQAQFAENTREAIERPVFGSPTYCLDGDMFYGQDRLELLERALVKPFD